MLPTVKCSGCGACLAACPKDCIAMGEDRNGFFYPVINPEKCVGCQKCEKACPVLNKGTEEKCKLPEAYAAFHMVNEVRNNSSSGGVFSALATQVLLHGGVVCGAAYQEDLSVCHIFVTEEAQMFRLRGSKYVQSSIGTCYEETKQYLKNGKTVLFSGTPCQVAGLLTYLEHPYENLITVDIICHGVPSLKVWKAYLDWQSKQHQSPIVKANFRDKCSGWEQFSMSLSFENGVFYNRTLKDDAYMKAFLQNLCLRESCYQCSFKTEHRSSDLTIGDLWGIQEIAPQLHDNKGVSCVLVQSEKGKRLLQEAAENLGLVPVDSRASIDHNGAMTHSVYRHPFRDYFFAKVGKGSFEKLVSSCLHPGYLTRLERKLSSK